MSILIIGAGMAGLASAVQTKEMFPGEHVLVVEQNKPVANTFIAGQRLRRKRNRELFPNDGNPNTEKFLEMAPKVLDFWEEVIGSHEEKEWFGPQLVNGSGKEALKRMKDKAASFGVEFTHGSAVKLITDASRVEGIVIENDSAQYKLHADSYVLANGSSIGTLFQSTNVANTENAHTLAYRSGVPLVGGTVNMFHPFGKSGSAGCYATDDLEKVTVHFDNGEVDEETTNLLRNHNAHENFPSICARFVSKGNGKVILQFPDGKRREAQVALHSSLLGIGTVNGIKVIDKDNLFAVGDASSFGETTGYSNRPAGTGQLKCLVDGSLVAQELENTINSKSSGKRVRIETTNGFPNEQLPLEKVKELKRINITGLLATEYAVSNTESQKAIELWKQNLSNQSEMNTLVQMSMGIANAHLKKIQMKEPISITSETSGMGRVRRV